MQNSVGIGIHSSVWCIGLLCWSEGLGVRFSGYSRSSFQHLTFFLLSKWVFCNHIIVRPRVADGGMASIMQISCKYIE